MSVKRWNQATGAWDRVDGAGGAVLLTGNQTVAGVKEFAGDIIGSAADRMQLYARRQATVGGGGVVSVNSSWEFNWTVRFMAGISQGREAGYTHSSGFVQFAAPAAGTVITGVGGAANVTVTSGGIPMTAWTAIWYVPGSVNAGTFYVSQYTSDFVPPRDWILVGWRDNDPLVCRVCNGLVLKAGESVDVSRMTNGNLVTVAESQTITGRKSFVNDSINAVDVATTQQLVSDKVGIRINSRTFFGYDNGRVVVGDYGASKPISFRIGSNNDATDEKGSIDAVGNLTMGGGFITNDMWSQPTFFSGGAASSSSSTTFTPVTSGANGTFVAPPSGRVLMACQMYLRAAGTGYAYGDIEIREGVTVGSGTLWHAAGIGHLVNANAAWIRAAYVEPYLTLTPNQTYNARLMFASSASGQTVQASHGQIMFFPIP